MKRRIDPGGRLAGAGLMVLVLLVFSPGPPAVAQEALKEQILVEEARLTLHHFRVDPNMTWFREHLKDAKALLIVPGWYKGGFFLGGSGGKGILVAKDDSTGEWSEPAFYTVGSVTLGVQIGGEKAEVIMTVMTRKALGSLHRSSFKLGGDASVAAGPVGVGTKGDLRADIISFTRSRGAYVGFSAEGAFLQTDEASNRAYYGKEVYTDDIITKREVSHPGSAKLREDLKDASK